MPHLLLQQAKNPSSVTAKLELHISQFSQQVMPGYFENVTSNII